MKKFIGFLFTVIITAGLTFVLVSGNFFMFNLVLKNQTKAVQELNEVLAGFDYAKYYDMTVLEHIVNGDDELTNNITLKVAYDEDHGMDFMGHKRSVEKSGEIETVNEFDFYYVDGYLYINNEEAEEKSKSSLSFDNAIDNIFLFGEIVLIETFDVEEEFVGEETVFSTQLATSFSPFYVGLGYSFHNGTSEDTTEYTLTFKLDMLQQFRGISYNVRMGVASYNIATTVLSYNKPLTLTLPTDLETYLDI